MFERSIQKQLSHLLSREPDKALAKLVNPYQMAVAGSPETDASLGKRLGEF